MQPSAMVNDVRGACAGAFRVNARRFAAHQFGDGPSRYRPERETLVPMSKVHPELFVPRRASEDRLHIGHAGPGAEPWLSFDGLAEVNQIARDRLCTH